MSFKRTGLFLCVLLLASLVRIYGSLSWSHHLDKVLYEGKREKRASYPFNPFLYQQGLNAVNRLLWKAQRIWTSSRKFRKYEIRGDENDAIRDFHSLNPRNIEVTKVKFLLDHKEIEGLDYKGIVGDREVHLLRQGDGYSHGRPVLDVIENRNSAFPKSNDQSYIDRFIYKDKPTH